MYNKDDKRRLYWLIDKYLSQTIDELTFCDEFYYCYSLELDHNTLNETEKSAFSELHNIVSRFSPHEEDHKLYPETYFTVEQLSKKILETKEALKGSWIL